MPQLDVTTFISQFFWLTVCFVTLYLILAKYILPRAEKMTQKRWVSIEGKQQEAQKISLQSQNIDHRMETTLADAHEEAHNLTRKLSLTAKNKALKTHEEAVTKSEQRLKDAEQKNAKDQDTVLKNIASQRDTLGEHLFQQMTKDLLSPAKKKGTLKC